MRLADDGAVDALDLAVGADDAHARRAGAAGGLVEVFGRRITRRIDRSDVALAVGRAEIGDRLPAILAARDYARRRGGLRVRRRRPCGVRYDTRGLGLRG